MSPTLTADVPADWFHTARAPFSLTNMNSALLPVPGTVNAAVSLNACPVGAPPGILTTSACGVTGWPGVSVRYSVETSAPLSETHNGVFGPCDMPQALTRLGSVT